MRKLLPRRGEDGFTLIELLIVIVIIGILAAVALPFYLNQQKAASEASLKDDLHNAGIAMQTAAVSNGGNFPSSLPSDARTSPGNVLTLTAEQGTTNLAAGQQGATGVNPGRVSHYSNAAYPTTTTISDYQEDSYTSSSYGGPYWDYVPPSGTLPQGTPVTASLQVRSTAAVCFNLQIEEHKSTSGWTTLNGANTCLSPNTWTTMTVSGNTDYDTTTLTLIAYKTLNSGDTFDYKTPVITLGSSINSTYVNSGPGAHYCIQGYNQGNPSDIWSYSSLNAGLKKGGC